MLAGCTSSSADKAQPGGDVATCVPSSPAQTGGLAGGGGECLALPSASATEPTESTEPTKPTVAASSSAPPAGPQEVEGECPYLTRKEASDLEGSLVGRVTVVTADPPGCNFYFAYGDGHMLLRISAQRFADPIDAYNAMVTAANAGSNADPVDEIGDDAVLYQVGFYDVDAAQDWACAFVKGGLLVTVNTDQKSPSFNARNIAETIAPRIS